MDNFTDTITICIKIEDLNDNPPSFMNDNATFVLKENMIVNSFVGQVIALDRDSTGPNSDVSFRFVSDSIEPLLKIYKSGVISNRLVFDREMQQSYVFQVEAYDSGKPAMRSVGTFYLEIEGKSIKDLYMQLIQ